VFSGRLHISMSCRNLANECSLTMYGSCKQTASIYGRNSQPCLSNTLARKHIICKMENGSHFVIFKGKGLVSGQAGTEERSKRELWRWSVSASTVEVVGISENCGGGRCQRELWRWWVSARTVEVVGISENCGGGRCQRELWRW
jgi:hypothetical protein